MMHRMLLSGFGVPAFLARGWALPDVRGTDPASENGWDGGISIPQSLA
jgi:hypothetical protein